VVPDVGVQEERERVLLVLEDVANMVLVMFRKGVDRDVVARFEVVVFDMRADIVVAGVYEFDLPLISPVFDKVGDVVEVLKVIDEHRSRLLVAVLLGNLVDEVQRQRRVFATCPHDRGIVVLFEAASGDLNRLLDFVL